ncbi:MAG: hypothetical protein CSB47_05900 [Proteobacteria bacterium]|nr:MAG: hypothetical protein CSB47_05900 [Pseudomonadota bacterium]
MKVWKSIACLTMALCTANGMASDENEPFASLQWTFGSKGLVPDVVVGYRSVDVATDGDVSGWQGSVSYRPGQGLDKLKLEGVVGDEDVQATYGGGYSLQEKQALLTAGVTGKHLVAGADYLIGKGRIEPYAGITTLDDYDVPQEPVVDTAYDDTHVEGHELQEEYFPEYEDCEC